MDRHRRARRHARREPGSRLRKGKQGAAGADRPKRHRRARHICTRAATTAPCDRRRWRRQDALSECAGPASLPHGGVEDPSEVCEAQRHHQARVPPYPPSFLRNASPGGRSGPQGGAGNARTRGYFHDADLYARRSRVSAAGAPALSSATMILVIDNYDSFTFNLVQYLGELGAQLTVRRNDEITVDDIGAMEPTAIVISPGPCAPAQAGISVSAIQRWGSTIPTLGVCLGHQAIGEAYGGRVIRATRVMHGKRSDIEHDGTGLFDGLPSPLPVMRYHSLIV